MYILDFNQTNKALKFLEKIKKNWSKFEQYAKKNSKNPKVDYGNGLFFHAGLFHGFEY